MRTIFYILQKEFIQIKRDRTLLPIIFVVPIVQLLILVHAATFEMKNINLSIVDMDLSTSSKELVEKFKASPFFKVIEYENSVEKVENSLEKGKIDLIMIIPQNFENNLIRNNFSDIQLLLNAINQTTASIGNSYCQKIIYDFNKNLIVKYSDAQSLKAISETKFINTEYQFWYNPELNYKTFMVPGILVILVTIIGMFLSAMNLVKEKEIGTIEQINVTPIKKYQFIIGKVLPFFIIALIELAFGLILGKLFFHIDYVGNLGLLFLASSAYLIVILGFGLLISTITSTQQQAMFIAWFFLLVFILMSGLFTSTDGMPLWAKIINFINPIAYFIKIVRMILLKGSDLFDVKNEILILFGYGVVVFSLAIARYRKTN